MNLIIENKEEDYLTFHLYNASQSKDIQYKKKRSWILITLAFLMLAYLFYSQDNTVLSIYFLVFAIISVIGYPFYWKYRMHQHYKSHVINVYAGRLAAPTELILKDDFIAAKSEEEEWKFNTSQIKSIARLPEHFFIKLKTANTFILPKRDIKNPASLDEFFNTLSLNLHFPYFDHRSWKW